jgi:hypothetical protein
MKRIVYFLVVFALTACSDIIDPHGDHKNQIVIYGRVVETYYTANIIFSVRPLAGVDIKVADQPIATTDNNGEYHIHLHKEAYYTIVAEKEGYFPESTSRQAYLGNKYEMDFYLEQLDEDHHDWGAFNQYARISITADGLCLYSLGNSEIYATRTVTLPNQKTYKFSAKMKKDPVAREIYFGIRPQINGVNPIYDRCNISGWHPSEIVFAVNDTTVIDYEDIGGTLMPIYNQFVDVVLEIGVSSTGDYPIGYFNHIKVEDSGQLTVDS